MSGTSRGILAVIAAGVLLGLSVVLAYTLLLVPKQERERVQAEVEDYGEKWRAARACLVGPSPRSNHGAEAMLLREVLEAGPELERELASCLGALKALRREAGFTSGDEEVETAWAAFPELVRSLGEAHMWRTARERPRPLPVLREALALAIPPVDAALGRLREAAGMAPAPPSGDGPLSPLGEGQLLAGPGGGPLEVLEPSLASGVFYGEALEGEIPYTFRQTGPDRIELRRRGSFPQNVGEVRWGGWSAEEGAGPRARSVLRAGPLDESGHPASEEAPLVYRAAREDQRILPLFALGDGPDRALLYMEHEKTDLWANQISLSLSRDGGATWPERALLPPAPAAFHLHRDPARRRADFQWIDPANGDLLWIPLSEASLGAPLSPRRIAGVADARYHAAAPICVSGERAWWAVHGALHHAGPDKARVLPVPGGGSVQGDLRCAGDLFLSAAHFFGKSTEKVRLTLCRPEGCLGKTEIPLPRESDWLVDLGAERGPLIGVLMSGLFVLWGRDPEGGEALVPLSTRRTPDGWRFPGTRSSLDGPPLHRAGLIEWDGAVFLVAEIERETRVYRVTDR